MTVRWILAAVLGGGLSAAALCGPPVADATPDATAPSGSAVPARHPAAPARTARAVPSVTVKLPPMPVSQGRSFAVSPTAVTAVARRYVAAGGDPADSPRFFFRDVAVSSFDSLTSRAPAAGEVRTQLGNLAASGYFGGIWLRDSLRDTPADTGPATPGFGVPVDLTPSAVGMRLFDAVAAGVTAAAASPQAWVATAAAHVSVPMLLALYGYNRGYLEVLLDNPPTGVASMRDTLTCNGFLDCRSSVFDAAIATRYDTALTNLANPTGLGWLEMAAWSAVLQTATGAGRFVWNAIAAAGSFSPSSYTALVDLSSAYLMLTKTAVLAAMTAAVSGDADVARTALLFESGLTLWSGAYFAGLASDAPRGTLPTITMTR